eukprot:c23961_g1_i1 orf=422-3370(-)
MASEDEDEYVTFGTRLEREEDVASGKRKRQALDQGRLRVGAFSQEVFDENGRRRFHGAFTGGFSAGYYNTVGSKEGWVPQSFTSSRKNRAELAQQRAYDYMDDEEKAEQDSTRLATASDFDTFGFTAAEFARKEAEQELKKWPSAIPGLVLDEIIVPVSRSIGFELLRKMGWRHGRAIGPKHIAASSDAQREGRKAMLAFAPCDQDRPFEEKENAEISYSESDAEVLPRSTPIYVINPKKDRYGFGFDPYKNAPEFRERHDRKESFDETRATTKNHRAIFKPSLFRPNVGRMGSGFGIGALEELGEEDEDVYAPGVEIESVLSDDEAHAPSLKSQLQLVTTETRPGVLPGFKPASQSGSKMELFPPPVVPPDFDGKHQFKDSLESEKVCLSYEPPEVAPPDDLHLRKLIEGLATFVARSGQKLESLYMEKRDSNPLFEFLVEGGNGHDYYKRKLWEEQRKDSREEAQGNKKQEALDSVQRGQLLGEIPLRRPSIVPAEDRARMQSALSSTFTKSSLKAEDSLPFSSDPPKQVRFEQYLKEKYRGGLRNVQAMGKSNLTEWERAQENLEFEAACQNLQKEEGNLTTTTTPGGIYQKELQAIMNERFALQPADKVLAGQSQKEVTQKYPMREEQPWRPRPLLCKRFNLPDPYSGKPPPLPKPRSRTESFILLSNPTPSIAKSSIVAQDQRLLESAVNSTGSSHSTEQDTKSAAIEGLDIEEEGKNIVEKPVDLYKAIFSDDSDDENAEHEEPRAENRSAEAAQAALNRLEAGDFLASIGKELGLSVPPSEFNQTQRVQDTFNQVEATGVLGRSSAGLQISKGSPHKLQNSELASISLKQDVDTCKGREKVTEEAGLYLDYSRLELNAEHFDVFSSLSSKKSTKKSVFQDIPPVNIPNFGKKDRPFSSKSQASSEESVSEDSSDDSNRRSRKRRKKDRKHSKSEKRRSERDHKRKKKHGDSEHQSHKHHHRKGRHKSTSNADGSN